MDKNFNEIFQIAAEFDLDSKDAVVKETRFILNMILGHGPADMMQVEGQLNFLKKCADGTLGGGVARQQASRNVHSMLFGYYRGAL